MGSLTIPESGLVYLDAAPVIYSVEKHAGYWDLMRPVWESSQQGRIELVSSELLLLEVLTGPLKHGQQQLVTVYEHLLGSTEMGLLPITATILRQAARLRAESGLKTPDAIHAATALDCGAVMLITNDSDLRRLTAPLVVTLSESLTA
jgi:predicted nucleic acid-binding protein